MCCQLCQGSPWRGLWQLVPWIQLALHLICPQRGELERKRGREEAIETLCFSCVKRTWPRNYSQSVCHLTNYTRFDRTLWLSFNLNKSKTDNVSLWEPLCRFYMWHWRCWPLEMPPPAAKLPQHQGSAAPLLQACVTWWQASVGHGVPFAGQE